MVWSKIVWFQIMNLMVWVGSGVGQSACSCENCTRFTKCFMIVNHVQNGGSIHSCLANSFDTNRNTVFSLSEMLYMIELSPSINANFLL